jgi:hypothetical protein
MDAQAVTDKNGKRVAALRVKNNGNRHGYLNEMLVQLSNGEWSAKMTPAEVQRKIGFGVIQPGKERRFILPIEVPEHVSSISASVERQ